MAAAMDPSTPTPSALDSYDPETRRLMRETIQRRIQHGASIGEAVAEARGLANGREPDLARVADEAIRSILRAEDIETPDMIALEWEIDGRTYREAGDDEVGNALAYAIRFDETGKARKTGWDWFLKIAALELARRLRKSNFRVLKGPPAPNHSTGGVPEELRSNKSLY